MTTQETLRHRIELLGVIRQAADEFAASLADHNKHGACFMLLGQIETAVETLTETARKIAAEGK